MNKIKNKIRKTYGVYGIIEWHTEIKLGRGILKVSFTGGAITTLGVTPASYTTSNPIAQLAIENSPHFKSGKIKIVRKDKLEETYVVEVNEPVSVEIPVINMERKPDETSEKEESEPVDNIPEEVQEPELPEEPKLKKMEFACNDDAKDYLHDTFGASKSRLLNRETIIAAGKSYGVEIIFT